MQMVNNTARKIRSFVKREGRLTKGQAYAMENLYPVYHVDLTSDFIDFQNCFKQHLPVILEIGFGMGDSLVEMAESNPQYNYLGIEVHRPGIGALLLNVNERSLKNIRVINHDAVEVITHHIADQSLAGVQIFFPDPWHKKRHHKRRIIQPDFIALLHQKLQLDGFIHLATDWQAYAEHMLTVMQAASGFKNCASKDYLPRPLSRPLTKFEKRGQRLGHGVWDLKYLKTN
jgi:tRNA (guanine-N7-)-methyltransferase